MSSFVELKNGLIDINDLKVQIISNHTLQMESLTWDRYQSTNRKLWTPSINSSFISYDLNVSKLDKNNAYAM